MNTPDYHVPALEKGLDILECLAAQRVPMTQAHLARVLDRKPSELFRMLSCLERRGYLQKDPFSSAYSITLRLFELGHTHSPVQGLLRAAARPMREFADTSSESCHLSVLNRGHLLVVAREESPAPVRLSVELGSAFPLFQGVSGRLLLAFSSEPSRRDLLSANAEYAALSRREQVALERGLEVTRERGYEVAEFTGKTNNIAVLVGAPDANVQASLAVISLQRDPQRLADDLLQPLRRCADAIADAAGMKL